MKTLGKPQNQKMYILKNIILKAIEFFSYIYANFPFNSISTQFSLFGGHGFFRKIVVWILLA